MKQKKSKKTVRKLHVAIALHPVMILGVLVAGVLLTVATFTASAQESYVVTAVVPAEPISIPATITSPTDQTRITVPTIAVDGSCPVDSYVKILRNEVIAGMAMCNAGTYSLAISLLAGTNALRAQVYNVTDQAGPSSPSIRVFYDEPVTPVDPTTPPPVAPIELTLMTLDRGVSYNYPQENPLVSNRPVFTGLAPPGTKIDVEVDAKVVYCQAYATASGFWLCALKDTLEPGNHTAKFTATLPNGEVRIIANVEFYVAGSPVPTKPAPQPVPVVEAPFQLGCDCNYAVVFSGKTSELPLFLRGGIAPYALVVDWGDGTVEYFSDQRLEAVLLKHDYKSFNDGELRQYQVSVAAYDANGTVQYLQTSLTVRNPAFIVAGTTNQAGVPGSLASWLWPAYAIIVLMLVSFWLGERQELALVNTKHKRPVDRHHKARR